MSILNNYNLFETKFNHIVKETIVGINTPFLFFGKKASLFGMHS